MVPVCNNVLLEILPFAVELRMKLPHTHSTVLVLLIEEQYYQDGNLLSSYVRSRLMMASISS